MSSEHSPRPVEPIRILHLEDSPADAESIRRALESAGAFEVRRVTSPEAFIEGLAKGGFDVILSDFRPRALDGAEALRLAREKAPGVPFLFVSDGIGEEAAVQAVVSGAADFILKPSLFRLAMREICSTIWAV